MNQLSRFFYNKTSLLFCIGATLLMVLYASQILGSQSTCFYLQDSLNALGLSFGYSPETANSFFSNRSAEQIYCYKDFIIIWDNIFPLLYGLMYVLWISFLYKKIAHQVGALNLFPVFQVVMDWLENIAEVIMANTFLAKGTLPEHYVQVGSLFSMLKWSYSTGTYLIIVIGIVLMLIRYVRNKQT